ncbi:MAG: T9SS type A sorting domain-containing protein [Bacteroidetes bacterium]|nr:MAG: T9SS type A sorting domain-containing protein [Bacteroidota bacterium]
MKRLYTVTLACLTSSIAFSQQDSVSLDPGYQSEVWYSLSNGEVSSNNISIWDLGFDVSPTGYAIRINAGSGIRAWAYPGDTSDFETLDTTGISGWTELTNGEISWYEGALNSLENGLDVGWGEYDMSTHVITGNRIFVLEFGNGSYQKLIINSLTSGSFYFRHASLDNSMDMSHMLTKSDFTNVDFGYFSLSNHSSVQVEPQSDWDLYFGKYTADLGMPYNVTGVLLQPDAQAVKAYPVNDPNTYTNWGSWGFSSDMNTIGYDWKSYNFSQGGYDIADSTVYFVKTANEDIYKVVFTGFGGSSTGKMYFNKSLVSTIGLNEESSSFIEVYPNPASDIITIVSDYNENATAQLLSTNGSVVRTTSLKSSLSTQSIDVSALPRGIYILRVQSGSDVQTERIIIQ